MRVLVAMAIAATASFTFDGNAAPGGEATCEAYVNAVLKMNKEVNELACGLDPSEPMWSLDPSVHMNFCLNASAESLNANWGIGDPESSDRQVKYQACKICANYTKTAMAQEEEDQKYKCNFAGTNDRWPKSDNDGDVFSKHMHFCMGLDLNNDLSGPVFTTSDTRSSTTQTETNKRDSDLKLCKANYHPSIGRARPTKEDLTRTNGRVIGLPQGAVNNPCVDSSGRMRRSLKECDPAAAASSSTSSSKVDKGLPKDAVHNPTGKSGVIGAGPLENDQSTSSRGPSAAGAPGAAATPGGVRSLGGATYGGGR